MILSRNKSRVKVRIVVKCGNYRNSIRIAGFDLAYQSIVLDSLQCTMCSMRPLNYTNCRALQSVADAMQVAMESYIAGGSLPHYRHYIDYRVWKMKVRRDVAIAIDKDSRKEDAHWG